MIFISFGLNFKLMCKHWLAALLSSCNKEMRWESKKCNWHVLWNLRRSCMKFKFKNTCINQIKSTHNSHWIHQRHRNGNNNDLCVDGATVLHYPCTARHKIDTMDDLYRMYHPCHQDDDEMLVVVLSNISSHGWKSLKKYIKNR